MNFYPFHVGDYAAHTAHLEPLEDLAYRRLLDLYYLHESPIPADVQEAARLVRMRQHAECVEAVLREFFSLSPDGWRHARCDAEIERMRDKQAKARASAEASVKARRANAQRTLSERSTDAQRTFNERSAPVELPIPIPTPDISVGEITTHPADAPRAGGDDGELYGTFEGHPERPAATPTPNPVAPFARALNGAGFRCTPLNPDLVAFVRDGGTIEHLLACAAASECRGKPATYVIRFARRELAEQAGPVTATNAGERRLSVTEQIEQHIRRRQRQSDAKPCLAITVQETSDGHHSR